MGLRRRLEHLEARGFAGERDAPPEVLLYLKHAENARREMAGEAPVPLTPEEEALDLETDRRFLAVGLPALRASPGWQDGEDKAVLDEWEREILARPHGEEDDVTDEPREEK